MNGWKYKTPLLVAIALLLFACNSPTPAPVPDNPLSGTALAAARGCQSAKHWQPNRQNTQCRPGPD